MICFPIESRDPVVFTETYSLYNCVFKIIVEPVSSYPLICIRKIHP